MIEYKFKILGIDPLWKKKDIQKGRYYIVFDGADETESYLIKKILFSMGKFSTDEGVFFVSKVPKKIKEKDIILCFPGFGESGKNILNFPHPSEILSNVHLKKQVWLDICSFLKKLEAG